ncbi:MAG: MMPL family transporter [Planctomycetota bacterium]
MSRRAAWAWIAIHAVLASLAAMRMAGAETDTSPEVFLSPDDPVRQRYMAFRRAFGDDPYLVVTGDPKGLRELEAVDKVLPLAPQRWLVRLSRRGPDAVDAVAEVCRANGAAFTGQPALRVALDREADAVGRQLMPVVIGAMALLLLIAYRSLSVTLAVLLTTGVGVLWGMAIVVAAPLNLVTVLLPVLLLALGTALCIHLVHAFRQTGDVQQMIRRTIRPCLITTITTAAGFGSFAFARIAPLKVLGVSMAAGILGMFILAFTLLPALITLFQPRPRDGLPIGHWLERVVPPVVRWRKTVLGTSAAVVAIAATFANTIPVETNALNYLPREHPLRVATEGLQDAGVGPTSIEFHLPALPPDLVYDTRELQKLGPPVRSVLSVATLPPNLFRGFLDPESKAVRLSVRCDYMGVEEYDKLLPQVLAIVDEEPTGDLPVVMTVQGELIATLLRSLAATTGVILLVLVIALRSLPLALLTLVPALIPLAVVVLVSALFEIPISIATVMVLAVTLGIVTDDSVHVVHAWRKGMPLRDVLHRVGTAVTETSMVITIGFAACMFTGFLPTRHFGLLTGVAMILALFADLVLFPALLGPADARRKMLSETPHAPA